MNKQSTRCHVKLKKWVDLPIATPLFHEPNFSRRFTLPLYYPHVLGRRNDMSYVEACALHQLFLPVWKLMSSVSKSVFSRYSYFLNDSDFKSLNKEILMISWAEMIKHFIESYKLIKKKLKTKSSKSQNNFRAI